jgi:hypothetical protein
MTLVIDVSCKGSSQTKRFVLNDNDVMHIGRSNEELNLASDPRLSRKHFIVRYDDGSVEIEHLSSTNPTLLAPEGSADFKKVNGTHLERASCRIIAGSHRFVLTVEKPDSVIEATLSDADHSDFWSDVDDDDQEPIPESPKGSNSVETLREPETRIGGSTRKPVQNLFDDDSVQPAGEDLTRPRQSSQPRQNSQTEPVVQQPESPRQTEPPKQPEPKQSEPAKPDSGAKPFFPITDDFFDD